MKLISSVKINVFCRNVESVSFIPPKGVGRYIAAIKSSTNSTYETY